MNLWLNLTVSQKLLMNRVWIGRGATNLSWLAIHSFRNKCTTRNCIERDLEFDYCMNMLKIKKTWALPFNGNDEFYPNAQKAFNIVSNAVTVWMQCYYVGARQTVPFLRQVWIVKWKSQSWPNFFLVASWL